jgi:hypothetical protein
VSRVVRRKPSRKRLHVGIYEATKTIANYVSRQYLFVLMKHLLGALLLFSLSVSPSPLGFPDDSDYTSIEPHDLQKTRKVRIAVLTCSSVSMAASLVVFYWLCRMEARFRHR